MIGHAAAALALAMAQAAVVPARPCIFPEEVGAGAAVALPEMIAIVSRGCAQHLAPDVFLRTGGAALAERWRTESEPQRRLAMAGAMRMMPAEAREAMMAQAQGSGGLPAAQPSIEAVMPQLLGDLEPAVTARLNPETCKQVSRFVESIAPLPAENVALMVSALLGFAASASEGVKGENRPPICRR